MGLREANLRPVTYIILSFLPSHFGNVTKYEKDIWSTLENILRLSKFRDSTACNKEYFF